MGVEFTQAGPRRCAKPGTRSRNSKELDRSRPDGECLSRHGVTRPSVRHNERLTSPVSSDPLAEHQYEAHCECVFSKTGRVGVADNDVLADVSGLIDAWCDRRELRALARLLPAWLANDGLTDGWAGVLDALRTICADGSLPGDEAIVVDRCIVAVESAVYRI
jgi:hypothetical protein